MLPRSAPVPTNIDIRSISSYAQAEVLVQRAQQSILNTDNRCGCGVDGDDDLYGGGEGGRDGGRSPLSAKLAVYGESLTLERRLRGTEEEKVVDAASEVGVGEINPAVFTVLGEGVIVREFAMRGCWICLGRRTLRGRGFITRGGLIPATVVRFSYRIAYINPIIYSLTTQIPFPIPKQAILTTNRPNPLPQSTLMCNTRTTSPSYDSSSTLPPPIRSHIAHLG
jgi:hypothetical protein